MAVPRVAVVGVGNEFNGDDAAGLLAARFLAAELGEKAAHVMVIEAGVAPENFTGPLRRFQPQVVLFLDAAWLPLGGRRVVLLERAAVDGFSASTHSQPLSRLAEYLENELGCAVGIIGIRAEQTAFGAPVSPRVKRACRRLAKELANMFSKRVSEDYANFADREEEERYFNEID